jgi:hypothetical protein
MIPIPDKSWVTGEYVENWSLLRTNYPYIVLTLDDGIVFKVVENRIKQDGKLRLISLNPMYETYEIEASQVKEVWKFVHYISSEMPEANMPKEKLMEEVQSLKQQVLAIQTKLSL